MEVILYGSVFSPPCRAVLITSEAIGVSVKLKNVNIGQKEHLTPEFLKMNPQHTVPTLDDNGTIVIDSHAILTYLVSKYAKNDSYLYPKELGKRALVDARLHFDSGVAFSLLKTIYKSHLYEGQIEYLTNLQTEKILDVYALINTFLERTEWIAGDSITIADVSLVTTVNSLEAILDIDADKYPKIVKWSEKANELRYFSVNKIGREQYANTWKIMSKH